MPLAESRVFLEKLDSLDYKYEYQIEKMLRVATMGRTSSTSNALQRFKPRPDLIVSKFAPEESMFFIIILLFYDFPFFEHFHPAKGDERTKQIYRPPKIRPMEMPGSERFILFPFSVIIILCCSQRRA